MIFLADTWPSLYLLWEFFFLCYSLNVLLVNDKAFTSILICLGYNPLYCWSVLRFILIRWGFKSEVLALVKHSFHRWSWDANSVYLSSYTINMSLAGAKTTGMGSNWLILVFLILVYCSCNSPGFASEHVPLKWMDVVVNMSQISMGPVHWHLSGVCLLFARVNFCLFNESRIVVHPRCKFKVSSHILFGDNREYR